MTREEVKIMKPIIEAFSEGKEIQIFNDVGGWVGTENLIFDLSPKYYRIKPEPKYRPFKTQEECWQEMQKHQPFGWITLQCGQKSGSKASIIKLTDNCFYFVGDGSGICHNLYNYEFDKHFWLFADGTPFGIKVEEE